MRSQRFPPITSNPRHSRCKGYFTCIRSAKLELKLGLRLKWKLELTAAITHSRPENPLRPVPPRLHPMQTLEAAVRRLRPPPLLARPRQQATRHCRPATPETRSEQPETPGRRTLDPRHELGRGNASSHRASGKLYRRQRHAYVICGYTLP